MNNQDDITTGRIDRIAILENEMGHHAKRLRQLEERAARSQALESIVMRDHDRIGELANRQIETIGINGKNGKVGVLRKDMDEMESEMKKKLADHELRINATERINWKIMAMATTGAVVGGAAMQLIRMAVGG